MSFNNGVYVASKFENKEVVRHAQKLLMDAGFFISYDWTPSSIEGMSPEKAKAHQEKQAVKDLEGVINADTLFFICYPGMKGAYVELGIALGYSQACARSKIKNIVIVGRDVANNVFFFLPPGIANLTFAETLEEGVQAAVTHLRERQAEHSKQALARASANEDT